MHGEPPQDGSGPPKVDSQVEVLHEKVTKQVIKEGHGQKPSKYSTCFGKPILYLKHVYELTADIVNLQSSVTVRNLCN